MKAETNEKKELTPGKQTMQQAAAVSSPLFESGGEFVLPDYLPKVQKVLRLEANALPPTRYMSGSEITAAANTVASQLKAIFIPVS